MQNFFASNWSKVSLYWAWNLKPRKTHLLKRVKKKDSSKKNVFLISQTWHLKKFFSGWGSKQGCKSNLQNGLKDHEKRLVPLSNIQNFKQLTLFLKKLGYYRYKRNEQENGFTSFNHTKYHHNSPLFSTLILKIYPIHISFEKHVERMKYLKHLVVKTAARKKKSFI